MVLAATLMTTPKYQTLIRNGKQCYFFPDVTVEELTRGFLVDIGSDFGAAIKQLWDNYIRADKFEYFSVYVNVNIADTRTRELIYLTYQSLPASQVGVVGTAVPKQSVVVKKRRITSL